MSCSCRSASIAALAIPLLLALTSCGGDSPAVRGVSSSEYNVGQTGGAGQGKIGGDSGLLSMLGPSSNRADEGAALGVNAYLWRGALDTLSFMPLVSADPYGGVIVTDWYSPPSASGERFKATAYILGRQLRSDGVRVTVFRQVMQNGQWVDTPVSPVTTGDIENKILARARELRSQSANR